MSLVDLKRRIRGSGQVRLKTMMATSAGEGEAIKRQVNLGVSGGQGFLGLASVYD